MGHKRGFTLVELTAVMIILAVLTKVVIISFNSTIQQQSVNAANNNLATIYNAQSNYYYSHNGYCLKTTSASPANPSCNSVATAFGTTDAFCANSLADINCNLALSVTDNYYNYSCAALQNTTGFYCTATNKTNSTNVINTGGPAYPPKVIINVATYGGNTIGNSGCTCSIGNATTTVSNTASTSGCNGVASCTFTENNATFGDCCVGSSKDFSLSYTCTAGSAVKTTYFAARANEGYTVTLTCP